MILKSAILRRVNEYSANFDVWQREKIVLEESRNNEAKLREQVKNLLNNCQQFTSMQAQLQELSQSNNLLNNEKSRLNLENNDLKK